MLRNKYKKHNIELIDELNEEWNDYILKNLK